MRNFQLQQKQPKNGIPVSIKIRVAFGCFHREHSPNAYEIIDSYLDGINEEVIDFAFEEHESGPEILIYLAVVSGVLNLSSNIVGLIATIIRARSEGIKKGDGPRSPLKLIIRRTLDSGRFKEEEILEIQADESVETAVLERLLKAGATKLLKSKRSKSS
jgi:hypothetical protein